jgi:uncharacterized protein (DUF849 family)
MAAVAARTNGQTLLFPQRRAPSTSKKANRQQSQQRSQSMAERIVRLKACLNGQRDATAHPAVPVTPAQLARAAQDAVAAGAEAVHVHPRDADGRQSLSAADVGAAVAAVRAACPATPVGVTTGLWVTGDPRSRHAAVAGWAGLDDSQRPDFASVNVSEPGWQELVATLAAAGIAAEAGVWSPADADVVAGHQPAGGWLRIMVEVMGRTATDAPGAADEILDRLAQAGPTAPVLLHGEDEGCWPLVAHAGRRGLPTRIGLEDVLTGPQGEPVADNADLVRLAVTIWEQAAAAG